VARFTTKGPKGDQGPAGNATPTDTYDKLYTTNNGNGTNLKVGDDAWIGDINTANFISIQGAQNAALGGIIFGNGVSEKIETDGNDLILTAENDVILKPGSNYGYINAPELDGGNRIATWDYVNDTINTGKHGYSASFYSTVDQGPQASANTVQAFTFNNTDWATGITLANTSRITMTNSGKYNIAFSAQLHQTNSSGTINIWVNKNGTPMENTNTKLAITANNPYLVAAWNFFVDAAAGDYYQLIWSSTSTNTVIEYDAQQTINGNVHPAIPSIILTVNQVG
jgi:hypothetical protein